MSIPDLTDKRLLELAEAEDGCSVSAGGPPYRIFKNQSHECYQCLRGEIHECTVHYVDDSEPSCKKS